MKSEYSFEHFQKRRKYIKEKNKRTKRRLFMLFLTTFSTVLMFFLIIANLITPDIDIPALNNDYDKMSDVRSSDFKKRIDSRLEQIKVDDDGPTRIVEKQQKSKEIPKKEEKEEDIIKNFFANAEKIKDDIIKLDFSGEQNAEPPVPESAPDEPEPIEPPKPAPKKVEVTERPAAPPPPPAPYPPVQVKPQRYKVLVGQFNSPEEARRLSETISKSSGVRPFIRNHNGKYCVQVGSYAQAQKAQGIANSYQMKSYQVKVIND